MDQLAQHRRSVATTDQIALKTRNGFWARDGRNYVNIRKILPGDRVEEIYIYEFDKGNRLKASTYAKHAGYIEGQWLLEDLNQIIFKPNKISQQHIERARWGSLLNPKLIHLVVIKPNNLSIRDLYRYIHFLKINNQNRLQYEQALWFKITYPLATGVMVFLAIPIVLGTLNKATVGQRVVLGSCIGLVFHIFNKAAGQLGVVLDLNPALSVTFPTVLALLIALVLMRKVA
jgi:lipopolysaccharide export system permease protein